MASLKQFDSTVTQTNLINIALSYLNQPEIDEVINDRPGICWEMPHDIVIGDLVEWNRNQPIQNKAATSFIP